MLASQSPRRRELLRQLHVDFDVYTVDIDESVRSGEDPKAYVERMAQEKAENAWDRLLMQSLTT